MSEEAGPALLAVGYRMTYKAVTWMQQAGALMRKLQQAALASDAPAAQAAASLLACVDLESRKHLHGLADGPGISRDVLSEVGFACCVPLRPYPCE